MPSDFTLGTWNILATSYIRPDYYPNTPANFLDPAWRIPALVKRAGELHVDILCLQEVETKTFAALEAGLPAYSGRLAMKGGSKPDGCAIFYRTDRCHLLAEQRLLYTDGGAGTNANSGHVAQLMTLQVADLRLDIVNTHLKWDASGTPRDRQWGYRQASQAISSLPERTPAGVQIICGDFNVTSDSPVINQLTAADFTATHAPGPGIYSCNSSQEPKLIDYIFFRGPVRAEPVALPAINGNTPLPSATQPSDHLPLIAAFVKAERLV